jgi:hypothetical protein
MKHLKILLVSLVVGALSQALAADPPPPPSPSPPAAEPEKSTAAASEEQTKRLRAMGYKREVHAGVTVFCRNETPLGSRFDKKVCGNGDEIERNAQAARDSLQNGQRQGR